MFHLPPMCQTKVLFKVSLVIQNSPDDHQSCLLQCHHLTGLVFALLWLWHVYIMITVIWEKMLDGSDTGVVGITVGKCWTSGTARYNNNFVLDIKKRNKIKPCNMWIVITNLVVFWYTFSCIPQDDITLAASTYNEAANRTNRFHMTRVPESEIVIALVIYLYQYFYFKILMGYWGLDTCHRLT